MEIDIRSAARVCSNLATLRFWVAEIGETALTQAPAATRRDLLDAGRRGGLTFRCRIEVRIADNAALRVAVDQPEESMGGVQPGASGGREGQPRLGPLPRHPRRALLVIL
jgi:hypothetical protein